MGLRVKEFRVMELCAGSFRLPEDGRDPRL